MLVDSSWVHKIDIFRPCVCPFVCSSVGKVTNKQGSQWFIDNTYPELSVARATLGFVLQNPVAQQWANM